MRDIALDPVTGDILLTQGRMRLTDVPSGENVRQRLQIRLALWQGEYLLDTSLGIPYASYLGRKGIVAAFKRTLRLAAATCPGVASLDAFSATVDARRNAAVSLNATSASGAPVSLDAFRVGA